MDLRKPLLAGLTAGLGIDLLMFLRGSPPDPLAYFVLPLVISGMMVFLAWNGARPVKAFLSGMGDVYGALAAQEAAGWVGGLEARVQTPHGPWHIETWNGGGVQLWVTLPGAKEPRLFQHKYREAGRRLAEQMRLGERVDED